MQKIDEQMIQEDDDWGTEDGRQKTIQEQQVGTQVSQTEIYLR